MLDLLESRPPWQFHAFGKHPAVKEYFRLGPPSPFVEGISLWVEKGYAALTSAAETPPDFRSWRFWARGFGRESLLCGVLRLSSDSLGRVYPLLLMGGGALPDWEERWELIPSACERSWRQMEYLATNLYPDLQKLEIELESIPSPNGAWEELAAQRHAVSWLRPGGDPYACFLDIALPREAARRAARAPEQAICLNRGAGGDKLRLVSLWHCLLRDEGKNVPNVSFIGGSLDRAYLVFFRRALAPGDFLQLWSASAAIFTTCIGEHAMDLSALGREPIRPDRPEGDDARYAPLFDDLQGEVDKISLPSLTGAVDWEKVVRLAAEILAGKSKDLLVAGYLAAGLIHTRKLDGLALGLEVYADLLEQHGPRLFPLRERGRVRAVAWWLERSEIALKGLVEGHAEPQQLDRMEEHLGKVERHLAELLPQPPSTRLIREFLQRVGAAGGPGTVELDVREEPRPEAAIGDPAEAAAPPEEPAGSPGKAAGSPEERAGSPEASSLSGAGAVTVTLDGRAAADEGLRHLRDAAAALRAQDPRNPLAYRLARQAVWLPVLVLPPATAGRTLLPAPPDHLWDRIVRLQAEDSVACLEAVEAGLDQFIFWLDLNRFAAEALARSGDAGAAVSAIGEETAYLLQRLPGLDRFAFSDGTPFCDDQTRRWVKAYLPPARVAAPRAQAPAAPSEGALPEGEVERAAALIAEGKLIEAVEGLQKQLEGGSGCRRLHWRLAMCRVLMDGEHTNFALPHLEQVVAEIDLYRLHRYDPALAMEGLKLARRGFGSSSEPALKERAQEMLNRIARIDAAEMIRLAQEDAGSS